MLSIDALSDSALGVLESVFGVHVSSTRAERGTGPRLPEGAEFVSSIHFAGDADGQLLLALSAGDSQAVVAFALDRYAIELPVTDAQVHAEMMNILSAGVTGALARQENLRLSISTPDPEPGVDVGLQAPQALTLTLDTEEGLTFILCYLSGARKQ